MHSPNSYAVCIVGLGSVGMGAAMSCVKAGLTTYGVDLNPQAHDDSAVINIFPASTSQLKKEHD